MVLGLFRIKILVFSTQAVVALPLSRATKEAKRSFVPEVRKLKNHRQGFSSVDFYPTISAHLCSGFRSVPIGDCFSFSSLLRGCSFPHCSAFRIAYIKLLRSFLLSQS